MLDASNFTESLLKGEGVVYRRPHSEKVDESGYVEKRPYSKKPLCACCREKLIVDQKNRRQVSILSDIITFPCQCRDAQKCSKCHKCEEHHKCDAFWINV